MALSKLLSVMEIPCDSSAFTTDVRLTPAASACSTSLKTSLRRAVAERSPAFLAIARSVSRREVIGEQVLIRGG